MIPHFVIFVKKNDESLIHLFCECDVVTPIWDHLSDLYWKVKPGESSILQLPKNVWA